MFAAVGPETKLPNRRADLLRGEKLFQVHCALCHGPNGEGGRGPMLTRAKLSRAPDNATLLKVIEEGIRGTEMPGTNVMSPREMRQTAAYVRSLGKASPGKENPVPGTPALGAELYRGKGNCGVCHSIKGEGGTSGPVVGTSSAKTSDGAGGGVKGAANAVAPPSVGSSSRRPR